MKKVLIVLLSVLLALTFISCEKDKSGEVIQNYEDFVKTRNASENASEFCNELAENYADEKTGEVSKEFSDKDKDDIKPFVTGGSYGYSRVSYLIMELLDVDADSITITDVESVSGKIQDKLQENSTEYTASDIVIKFKYTTTTYVKGEAETSDPIEGELKINMKYSYKTTEEEIILSVSSLSLQGVSYKDIAATYSMTQKKTTSATVGGAAVELRLLNAK